MALGLDPAQFREHVVEPALAHVGLSSPQAIALLTATAIHESGLRYLRQLRGGPALGLFQIEPATARDILFRYLPERAPATHDRVRQLVLPAFGPIDQLAGNDMLGCALARVKYRMDPAPLPPIGDPEAMAAYWKRIYNTAAGAGDGEEFAAAYRQHILGKEG